MAAAFALGSARLPCHAAEPEKPVAPEIQQRPRISAHLTSTLKRANDALNGKNFDLALKELDAADAMPNKSAYDQRIIDQMKAFARMRTGTGAQ